MFSPIFPQHFLQISCNIWKPYWTNKKFVFFFDFYNLRNIRGKKMVKTGSEFIKSKHVLTFKNAQFRYVIIFQLPYTTLHISLFNY